MRKYFDGNKDAKDPTTTSQMRDYFNKVDSSKLAKNSKIGTTVRHTDSKQVKKEGVAEGYHNSKTIITEALIVQKLWEDAGHKLMEAQLTADQINQIFQQVEQGATAAGNNRTMLGRGKDAASAVNKAWEDLKTKVQNSGPIKGVDAMYDNAAEKLKQATGGDQGVMKYVQKYRDFAKKHPIAQSLIYSALIAAAGISGAGVGGAAALGLFKLVDKLLQGEKFSSAAYQGAKTGAMAYGASKLADYMKGGDQATGGTSGSGEVPADIQKGLASDQAFQDRILNKFPPDQGYTFGSSGDSLEVFDSTGRKVFTGDIPLKTMDMKVFADLTNNGQMATPGISSGSISGDPMAGVASDTARQVVGSTTGNPTDGMNPSFYTRWFINKYAQDPNNPSAMIIQQAKQFAAIKAKVSESIELTESQIFLMIGKIVERQRKLDEGIMDTIKGAAGKAVNWAQTKGRNLTTKVTADKLLQAWKKAGSPTDSLDVAKVIQNIGVPSDTIKQVYASMKIPFAGEPGGGAMSQSATSTQQAAPVSTPAAATAAAPATKMAVPAQQTTIPQVAPVTKAAAPVAKPAVSATTAPQGFNANNVMKMPGMEKYAKPAVAKPANFSGGPTGYANVNTTFKQPTAKPAKQPAMAEDELDENCWKGYHKEGNKELFGKTVPNCVKNEDVAGDLNEFAIDKSDDNDDDEYDLLVRLVKMWWLGNEQQHTQAVKTLALMGIDISEDGDDILLRKGNQFLKFPMDDFNQDIAEEKCPHCGGPMFSEMIMNEKKDACYYKVKSRYKVWPSAYASGALVKCRKSGADSWGNGGKKNESSILEGINRADENLHQWFKEKWVRFGPDGKIRGDCARGDDSEGKPKCLPQSKAQNLGKEGRASAAARKRREDPNPERSGKAINVNTKKKSNESIDEGWKEKLGAAALAGSMALGAAGAQARVTPGDDPNINRLTGKPIATQQATDTAPTQAEAPKGFSKEYLQKAADPNRFGRYMISVEKAQELLNQMNEDQLDEKWSQKYKDSINCSNPKGFSQKAHCQGKNK